MKYKADFPPLAAVFLGRQIATRVRPAIQPVAEKRRDVLIPFTQVFMRLEPKTNSNSAL